MEAKVYCWLFLGCLALITVTSEAKPVLELVIDPVGVGLLGAGLLGASLFNKGGKGGLNLGLGIGSGGSGGFGGFPGFGGLGGGFGGFGAGFSLKGIKPPRIGYPFFLPKPKTIIKEHHVHVQPHVSEILVHQKDEKFW